MEMNGEGVQLNEETGRNRESTRDTADDHALTSALTTTLKRHYIMR